MRRRMIWISLGIVLLFVSAIGAALGVLVKHEPSFFRSATMPEGDERRMLSGEFISRYAEMKASVLSRYPDWWVVFTTGHINAFLQEDFKRNGGDNNLPDGFHDMRVQIEEGKLRLGFRYGEGFWSTILSIDVKMWLVADEVNMIGLEIVNLRAGGLPVSRQIILDYITETARRSNIDVRWYHRKNNPVAILKLQADQVRPTIQLQRFELKAGKIVVVGRSTESHIGQGADRAGAH
jgi:hypothetical protein